MTWFRRMFCAHEWSYPVRVEWRWPWFSGTGGNEWRYVRKCFVCRAVRETRQDGTA